MAAEARLLNATTIRLAAERKAAEEAAALQAAEAQAAVAAKEARQAAALAERIKMRAAAKDRASRAAAARLAAPAPAPAPQDDNDVWARLRKCEAGGVYTRNSGNGYYGAYQFAPATWRSLGYSGLPHEAPPEVQDEAARKLQARSGWGQWPACSRRIGVR